MKLHIAHVMFPLIVFVSLSFLDLWAKAVFIFIVYSTKKGHGKSARKSQKLYKANWTRFQRLCWIPLLKEKYNRKYLLFPFFSLVHLLAGILFLVLFMFFEEKEEIWKISFIVFSSVTILRILYNNSVAKGIW